MIFSLLLLVPALSLTGVDNLRFEGSVTESGLGHRMDCEIVGDRAYLSVATSSSGLETYDISDPSNPYRLSFSGAAAWRAESFGDSLLVTFCRKDGVVLFDISGSTPVALGQYNPPGASEAIEGGDLVGDLLYCAGHQNGIYVIDISDPASPQKVDQFVPDSSYAWNLVEKDTYLLVANGRFGLSVIETQGNLSEVASLPLPGCANDVNLIGNTLVVSLGVEGVATVDVSDPLNPALQDTAQTMGCAWGSGSSGDLVAVGSWYVLELFDVSIPSSIVRAGWDNTDMWAMGADIRSDGLVGVADWLPMACYQQDADIGADIDLEPQVLDFGAVAGSIDTTVTVRNTGSGTLNVSSVSTPSDFSVAPGSFSVFPGDSMLVTVTASGVGSVSGLITYSSNDPDEPARTQEVYKNNTSFPQYGSPAPDFTLQGSDSQMYTLSDYQGRVVYLEFGGAW